MKATVRIAKEFSRVAMAALFMTCANSCTEPANTNNARLPLQDTGPYLCGTIPQGALEALLGGEPFQLDGEPDVDLTRGPVVCGFVIESNSTYAVWHSRVQVGKYAQGKFEQQENRYSDAPPLPVDLGDGRIRPAGGGFPEEYVVYALFRCGDIKRWVWINVGETVEGRDPIADGTTLMRMAQDRYAEVVECEITPPDTASPPPTDTPASG